MENQYFPLRDKDQSLRPQAINPKTINNPSTDQTAKQQTSQTISQTTSEQTEKQQMEALAEAIERLYCDRLGKRPLRVSCDMLPNRRLSNINNEVTSIRLVIWVEGSVTAVEKLLFESGDRDALLLCRTTDNLMRQPVIDVIESCLSVRVTTLILDTAYDAQCTGIIAQLSGSPDKLSPALFGSRNRWASK